METESDKLRAQLEKPKAAAKKHAAKKPAAKKAEPKAETKE
jgi:hypothetical protein